MNFEQLGLAPALLGTLSRLNYASPTPIQERAIPAVLDGHDLLAAAQTGTGKTAAFTLPIVQRLHSDAGRGKGAPRVLVLAPTRELAAQVEASVREYGAGLGLRSLAVFGGVSPNPQIKAFRRGLDVLVATPGRLLDHAQQGNVDLSAVEVLVLDEADRMLDMGFIHDIRKVIARLPAQRQNLMFSATFSGDIRKLAKGLLDNPQEIDVAPRNATAELVEHRAVRVAKHQKRDLLSWLIGARNWQQVLVFTRTKHGANRLCKQLETDGLPAAALHGNKSQNARTKALADFKAGRLRVLVATDIAARGLDIEQLPHVVNHELPNVPADYVHRIGRTGRAGLTGQAISLVCAEERGYLADIEKLLGHRIPALEIDGFHLQPEKSAPKGEAPARQQPGPRRKPAPRGGRDGQRPGGAKRRSRGGRNRRGQANN